MCGIAGYINPELAPVLRVEAVERMNAAMLHRGPDDAGVESWGDATLGMRRLAIFDPAHGHQPMSTPNGRWHLVFNGAIYNFRALRAELASSHDFKTECDTEVLLAAVARWGQGALPRLRGMFAFAAWDSLERKLLIARDSFGIKPIYVHTKPDGSLLFASELNALLASGCVAGDIDPQAVSDYLSWLSVPAPRTIYQSVKSLQPGECGVWQNGRLTITAYDTARSLLTPPAGFTAARSKQEFTAGLRAQLEDTVRAHIVADVPVGAFLSGGLDSTALVALMTRLSGARLKTFSIGFEDAGYSEAEAAASNARYLGADHHASVLTGARVATDISTLIASLDQPTGDGINTYYASQAARAGGVTVALSGLGADELFGGYSSLGNTFRLDRWLPVWNVVPGPIRSALLTRWDRGNTRSRKLADTLRHANSPASLALLQRRVFAESTRRSLLASGIASAYSPHAAEAALAGDLRDASLFSVASMADVRGYMSDVLLRDSDVMSMRHSLELRVPFVDRPFVNWVSCQPAAFKHTPKQPKSALADALADLLPPDLLTRKKRGFTLPYAVWMRGPLKPFLEDTFSSASVGRSGLFDAPAVQAHWQSFLAGNDTLEWSRVWSLAILVAFINRPRPASA
ncbi:asparagine synthase (glutamine-hydrolyzing) [Rariglobus hedericola]|uniref:asparagine synthase (glutamine-hydrolyzing) n=1 Tax=Rariglobus hedericola TaxID=2597822 RepID=A0A556QPV1_9BACT|nr:asparagine synthase (glutamine-hydrolyzing) [Rariglobus hedericola]TSJ78674.1 asparagine synthase (glutamine-hydrolyzing) [Rariglobus hedericola]